jgi:hypothetical protein
MLFDGTCAIPTGASRCHETPTTAIVGLLMPPVAIGCGTHGICSFATLPGANLADQNCDIQTGSSAFLQQPVSAGHRGMAKDIGQVTVVPASDRAALVTGAIGLGDDGIFVNLQ